MDTTRVNGKPGKGRHEPQTQRPVKKQDRTRIISLSEEYMQTSRNQINSRPEDVQCRLPHQLNPARSPVPDLTFEHLNFKHRNLHPHNTLHRQRKLHSAIKAIELNLEPHFVPTSLIPPLETYAVHAVSRILLNTNAHRLSA